jgi:hypothetical protein
MQMLKKLFVISFVLLSTAGFAQTPNEAGKVLMALGDVKVNRNNQIVPLAKGASVLSGDSVITGVASNAQLRMSDGAVIALRAQTEFKINEYRFAGKADGSEKASVSLVKGGVRAVTGVIGRENKDNLQINAVVATVGIRGTGFNINYCENGGCLKPDKTPAKDGLYAGVFEGQITVKNQVAQSALGVDQYLYVADEKTTPEKILQVPNFLPDPLAGQKSAKPKSKNNQDSIPSLATPVSAPTKSSSDSIGSISSPLQMTAGVVVNPSIYLAGANPFAPSNIYNDPGAGNGISAPVGTATNYLQKAEVWPVEGGGPINSAVDGLPSHNVNVDSNLSPPTPGMTISTAGSGNMTYVNSIRLVNYTVSSTAIPLVYSIDPTLTNNGVALPLSPLTNPAQQLEGGNYNGVVSWGRWANGNVLVADYNSGNQFYMPAGNGFHYIVGDPTLSTSLFNLGPVTLNYSLLAATTPTSVLTTSDLWFVTGGNMSANLATRQLSGNLSLYTNQSTGYAFLNMNYSGAITATNALPSNAVTTSVLKQSGSLALCAASCAGVGNVVFYGNNAAKPAEAAGLAYNFNTGNNVIQGVAVFKR